MWGSEFAGARDGLPQLIPRDVIHRDLHSLVVRVVPHSALGHRTVEIFP